MYEGLRRGSMEIWFTPEGSIFSQVEKKMLPCTATSEKTIISVVPGSRVHTVLDTPTDLHFATTQLNVGDMISGGVTRSVEIEWAKDETHVYLRATTRLQKREFEDIFGFECGQFIQGRMVRISASDVLFV